MQIILLVAMKAVFATFLLCFLAVPCLSSYGVDVSEPYSTATYQCMKNNGYKFVIIRGYYASGEPDQNAVTGLQNARAAGLKTDIYMSICRSKSATAQVDQMFSSISSNLFDMVWIYVEINESPDCGWGRDYIGNCDYLIEIINRIKSHGKNVGIYSTYYDWQKTFGLPKSCPQVASLPLWYQRYDSQADFGDFNPFGGWSKPSLKRFQEEVPQCGVQVNRDYSRHLQLIHIET